MKISVEKIDLLKVTADAVVVALFKDAKVLSGTIAALDKALSGMILEMIHNKEITGKAAEVAVIPTFKKITASKVIVVGLGEKKEFGLEQVRLAGSAVIKCAQKAKAKVVATLVPGVEEFSASEAAQALIEGALIGPYVFDKETVRETRAGANLKKKDDKFKVESLILADTSSSHKAALSEGVRYGQAIADSVNEARTLIYYPANVLTPTRLAAEAVRLTKKYPAIKTKVLGELDMKKLGMGALLGVGQGSEEESKLIVMEYNGGGKSEPLGLIGKGVTFDTGGISIKPSKGMKDMTGDMGGAACVLGSVIAAARLGLKKNVVGIIPTVENMPDGKAQRPGDVVTAMNGKTVEIINTDAEGRLILCDAMVYAQTKMGVKKMIDFATLTGACIVALGCIRTGVMSNHDEFCDEWLAASKKAGEKMWRLPMDAEFFDLLKSDTADMVNCTEIGEAGTVTAAKFLEQFVEKDTQWIHNDIAGTSDIHRTQGIYPKGPTGVGVRTVISLLRSE